MINPEMLSKQLNDTLLHRQYVMRSGTYLSKYLIYKKRDVDAVSLLLRCSEHDLSKLRNLDEFMALASIVDDIGSMSDVTHELTSTQIDAIKLHWKNNSHHPEHYESPNDMSELDIMEMACDCHARSKQYHTDLLEFIRVQQDLRFHFDKEHYDKLMWYARALVVMTKNDDYENAVSKDEDANLEFGLYNTCTLGMLEHFKDDAFEPCYKLDNLIIKKEKNTDFATVVYGIYLYDGTEVGYMSLKCNGAIEYKIFEEYSDNDYEHEAVSKLIEIATMNDIICVVRKENEDSKTFVKSLGFRQDDQTENSIIYRLVKEKEE